ncbi:hypothetical protein EXIGLDRAFT_834401 [Exidia glandulosa HHB12029]|uniref:Uncharacterized protein n=1 Tax=Exidia glandulosa HHB12029 TaxID=1314781 RepID=A0A165JRP2_EXIGL|nr:hypothetical protein EXIGLDRAFT_834401 [Exidia glandulosa HHB12029]
MSHHGLLPSDPFYRDFAEPADTRADTSRTSADDDRLHPLSQGASQAAPIYASPSHTTTADTTALRRGRGPPVALALRHPIPPTVPTPSTASGSTYNAHSVNLFPQHSHSTTVPRNLPARSVLAPQRILPRPAIHGSTPYPPDQQHRGPSPLDSFHALPSTYGAGTPFHTQQRHDATSAGVYGSGSSAFPAPPNFQQTDPTQSSDLFSMYGGGAPHPAYQQQQSASNVSSGSSSFPFAPPNVQIPAGSAGFLSSYAGGLSSSSYAPTSPYSMQTATGPASASTSFATHVSPGSGFFSPDGDGLRLLSPSFASASPYSMQTGAASASAPFATHVPPSFQFSSASGALSSDYGSGQGVYNRHSAALPQYGIPTGAYGSTPPVPPILPIAASPSTPPPTEGWGLYTINLAGRDNRWAYRRRDSDLSFLCPLSTREGRFKCHEIYDTPGAISVHVGTAHGDIEPDMYLKKQIGDMQYVVCPFELCCWLERDTSDHHMGRHVRYHDADVGDWCVHCHATTKLGDDTESHSVSCKHDQCQCKFAAHRH